MLKEIYHECKQFGQVSLTFDDGPHQNTIQILDTLKKYNVKATFFITGVNVTSQERINILKRIIDEGHIIGSHTWSHFDLPSLSDDQIETEMKKTSDKIFEIASNFE